MTEYADRLAIRALVDAYAHCADRRDADGQKALFTADTHFVVYMDGEGTEQRFASEQRRAWTPSDSWPAVWPSLASSPPGSCDATLLTGDPELLERDLGRRARELRPR
jgi:SnoaL-like domain